MVDIVSRKSCHDGRSRRPSDRAGWGRSGGELIGAAREARRVGKKGKGRKRSKRKREEVMALFIKKSEKVFTVRDIEKDLVNCAIVESLGAFPRFLGVLPHVGVDSHVQLP